MQSHQLFVQPVVARKSDLTTGQGIDYKADIQISMYGVHNAESDHDWICRN
jgi:hypothetical protein